jgi:quercetin dioxygenase-like cupin family protein
MIQVHEQPKPDWALLTRPGCENVEFRVLLGSDGILIANLRFAPSSTIDRHSAPFDIDVICVHGEGLTSIGDSVSSFAAGQFVRWPKDKEHCLWTEEQEMETIMVERQGQD